MPREVLPYAFDSQFCESLALRLLSDPVLCSRLTPFIKPNRFAFDEVKTVISHAVAISKRLKASPNQIEVLQDIRNEIEAGKLPADTRKRCAAMLAEAGKLPLPSREFCIEQVLREERKSAMTAAMERGLMSLHLGDYGRIAEEISKAARLGKVDSAPGVNFGANLAKRTADRLSGKIIQRWGTGISDLDDMIRGGLAAGEVGCCVALPKFGKSQFLASVAMHTASLGGTSLIYSLELSEREYEDRMDAAIAHVLMDNLHLKALEVQAAVDKFFADSGGSIIVKQFPPKSASVRTIEEHMVMMREEQSIEPTVLIIDYGDELGYDTAGDEGRFSELGNVYTDMKRVAVEWGIPVWTASQAGRQAADKKVVGFSDVSESFRKVAVVDLMIAICGTEEERESGRIRFNVAACRFAHTGGAVGPYHSNFAMGRIVEVGGV